MTAKDLAQLEKLVIEHRHLAQLIELSEIRRILKTRFNLSLKTMYNVAVIDACLLAVLDELDKREAELKKGLLSE